MHKQNNSVDGETADLGIKNSIDIVAQLQWRYGAKLFDSEQKIADETVEYLIKMVNLTATSMGLQPFRLLVVKNKQVKQDLAKATYNQPQITSASHLLIFACRTDIDNNYIDNHVDRVAQVRQLSPKVSSEMKAQMKGWLNGFSTEGKEHWFEKQAYIGLGNLLTVLAIEGIDSCPIEGFNKEKFDQILDLKSKSLRSVLICPIGYRSADDLFQKFKKIRLSDEQFSVWL